MSDIISKCTDSTPLRCSILFSRMLFNTLNISFLIPCVSTVQQSVGSTCLQAATVHKSSLFFNPTKLYKPWRKTFLFRQKFNCSGSKILSVWQKSSLWVWWYWCINIFHKKNKQQKTKTLNWNSLTYVMTQYKWHLMH